MKCFRSTIEWNRVKELRKSEMKRLSIQFNLLNRYDKAIRIW